LDGQIKKNEISGACSTYGEGRITYGVLWGDVSKRNHLEGIDVDGRIILKGNGMESWTELIYVLAAKFHFASFWILEHSRWDP
jgi:hypothetical protein